MRRIPTIAEKTRFFAFAQNDNKMFSCFMFYLITLFTFIFGLIIGSFLNCLVWRLHVGGGMWGRSYCPKCKKQIAWHDNIPVFSFLFLKGKCRHCGGSISIQYPLTELIVAILFVLAFVVNLDLRFTNYDLRIVDLFLNLESKFLILLIRDWFLISVMIIIFIYDLRWYLILDKVTIPACVIVFFMNILLGFSWLNLLISGIIGGSFFLLQFVVSRGKWIGGGDIRLGVLMGLSLGWPNVILAIFLAYLIGSVVGIGLIFSGKKKWGSQVPMGIFLSTATLITLFWGNEILAWYLNLF